MNYAKLSDLNERQRFLLLAAHFHGARQGAPMRANSYKVLSQALQWAGLWNEQMEYDARRDTWHPMILEWYGTLIAMTREPNALLQGAGNMMDEPDGPAYPHYTSCGLTATGREIVETWHAEHPQNPWERR